MKKFQISGEFKLECGKSLFDIEVAYHTLGKMNATGSNVIWICHALTANSDPEEWWPDMVGKGKCFDPEKYFIVCANVMGSCYGSTYAGSTDSNTGNPYGADFPLITVKDQVKALMALRENLDISRIHLAVGAALGGQQVLEWSITEPLLFDKICLIATNARHSPWGIAFNETQRMAILADESTYTDAPDRGWKGMAAARSIAMLSYRNYKIYELTQMDTNEKYDQFKAASYQQYQGEKLCKRFHPWAYISLTHMIDSHNVGRGRESIDIALQQVEAQSMIIGIESDLLYPLVEQQYLAKHIPRGFLKIINSRYGHDGFLIEYEMLTEIINEFLKEGL